jgi:hypothetical protein
MEDMSGVYVTFNQGVTEPKKTHGATSGLQLLRETATDLRRHCGDLERHGFRLDSEIDLRTEGTLGRDYEAATIAYKFYERGSVPDDPEIAQDLEALLTMYDQQINTPPDAKGPLTTLSRAQSRLLPRKLCRARLRTSSLRKMK